MPDKKKDRYDEIVSRLAELDEQSIADQNEKDAAIQKFRKQQSVRNREISELNRELIKVIKADPERAKKYQSVGGK